MMWAVLWPLAIAAVGAQCIVTVAGPLAVPWSPATAQQLVQPCGITSDGASGWFFADLGANTIQRVWANGTATVVMGTPRVVTSIVTGDGGAAASAYVNTPTQIASDGAGDVLIADRGMNTIRRLCANGTALRVAGNLTFGSSGDGGLAFFATLAGPAGVAGDGAGGVWIADTGNNAVRFVAPSGVISRVVGSGAASYSGDGGPALLATLNAPQAVLGDGAGGVWIADTGNSAVRRTFANGTIVTWGGNGSAAYCGDGRPASLACFANPTGIASDGSGGLLIADTGNSIVRRISAGGTVSCVAGTPLVRGNAGDGGPATLATAGAVRAVAADGTGGFAFTDASYLVVRYVSAAGLIRRIAGTGLTFAGSTGNGGACSTARLNNPYMIIGDTSTSSLLVVDRGVQGASGSTGNGGPGSSARLANPGGIASDGNGGWLIADTSNGLVRQVVANGTIVLVAGNRTNTLGPDGLAATLTALSNPAGVSPIDPLTGAFCIADSGSNLIRRVYPNGTAMIVAGSAAGLAGGSGSGVPGTSALFRFPRGLAFGPTSTSDVVVADSGAHTIRILFANGTVNTLAGTFGVTGVTNGPATSALFNTPNVAATDGARGYYVTSFSSAVIQRIFANGTVAAVAGFFPGYFGDGGPPLRARLNSPQSTHWDGTILWILDSGNSAIRAVLPAQQCVAPSVSQFVGCSASANGTDAFCSFSGLPQVPPLFVWLAGALCSTTVQPTPATNGAANASCPFASQGALQWLTQFGQVSTFAVIDSASQSATVTQSQSASGRATSTTSPTSTGSSTGSQTPTSTQTKTPSLSGTGTPAAAVSPTSTAILTGSPSTSGSGTLTGTPSATQTASQTVTPSGKETMTTSGMPTRSATQMATPSGTQTATSSGKQTVTPSMTPTGSQGTSASQAVSSGLSQSLTPTVTVSGSRTLGPTVTQAASGSSSGTGTVTSAATAAAVQTPTSSDAGASPNTGTPTGTGSPAMPTSSSYAPTVSPGSGATPGATAAATTFGSSSPSASVTLVDSAPSTNISTSTSSAAVTSSASAPQASSSESAGPVTLSSSPIVSPAPSLSASPARTAATSTASSSTMTSASPSATMSASSNSSPLLSLVPTPTTAPCSRTNVISTAIQLSGSVSLPVITSQALLLRLAVACGLSLPTSSVELALIANTTLAWTFTSLDAVNTASGDCSLVTPGSPQRRRGLGVAVTAATTNVTLRVSLCGTGASASTQVAAVVRSLQALLAQASGSNASAQTTLGAFLTAVASAAGVPPGAMFIAGFDAPVVAVAASITSGASSTPQATEASPGVIGGAVVGSVLGAALLVGFALTYYYMRRSRGVLQQRQADHACKSQNGPVESPAFEMANPMQPRREQLET